MSDVTHQVESFTFVNDTGKTAVSLSVTFDVKEVTGIELGVFGKSVTTKEVIAISKGNLAADNSVTITFQRYGAFHIVSYQWTTSDGASGGSTHPGPPGT